jgi:Family of unknown function (DUF6510)
MDALRLDGNAAAGALQEVFGGDVTTAAGTCANCGGVNPVGAVHVYVSAGTVLRCPICGEVLVRLVATETRIWVDLRGFRTLEVPR